ncbi:MAG: DJ-1/PfpI family protein [Filimonas sp.]|nr:DJ-1/PfpI family protein [Filimonas sp.]
MRYLLTWLSFGCLLFASCNGKQQQPTGRDTTASRPILCESTNYTGKVKIAIVIYDGVEVVDMNGPIDVFTKTNRIADHYYVYTVAAKDTLIYSEKCATALLPKYTIYNCPTPDIVVLPGCPPDVVSQLLSDSTFSQTILTWIKKLGTDTTKEIMSVCTGGILLGKTGLLDYRQATTHYLALQEMQQMYPKIKVIGGVRFVDDKNTISTAGITSGIDGALHIVEKYEGKTVADSVAHIMVYNRSCPMRDPSN